MIATRTIDNSADLIDSRDVIARIDYLQDEAEDCMECRGEDCVDGDHDEFRALKSLAEDLEGYCSDWTFGVTLIRDSYFEQYAEEMAGDIGAIDPKATWPLNHIDWEAAAEELKGDYTSAEFDGVTYWAR